MPHILVVEDEKHLALGLEFNLKAEKYRVTITGDGESALALLLPDSDDMCPEKHTHRSHKSDEAHDFDLVVLDIMLPGKDGFEVASELRAANQYVPILMLTARGRPEDVLKGFAAGADDYLAKPFDLAILLARVNGLLRRHSWSRSESAHESLHAEISPGGSKAADVLPYTFDSCTIDFLRQQVQAHGKTHQLTLMEVELLQYLIKHAGKPVSRKALLEEVWGLHEDTDTRAIDNFIVRLRKYLEDDSTHPKYLRTVRGVGYCFTPSGD